MNNYRPFWKRNPNLRRLTAFAMLVISPALVPVLIVAQNMESIAREVGECYAAIWRAMTED